MGDVVSWNSCLDIVTWFLVGELRGVASNDKETFARRELLFQAMKLRQNVQAVDAAVGEEIDKNQGAGQMTAPLEWLRNVEPVKT